MTSIYQDMITGLEKKTNLTMRQKDDLEKMKKLVEIQQYFIDQGDTDRVIECTDIMIANDSFLESAYIKWFTRGRILNQF